MKSLRRYTNMLPSYEAKSRNPEADTIEIFYAERRITYEGCIFVFCLSDFREFMIEIGIKE